MKKSEISATIVNVVILFSIIGIIVYSNILLVSPRLVGQMVVKELVEDLKKDVVSVDSGY